MLLQAQSPEGFIFPFVFRFKRKKSGRIAVILFPLQVELEQPWSIGYGGAL